MELVITLAIVVVCALVFGAVWLIRAGDKGGNNEDVWNPDDDHKPQITNPS